MTILFRPLLTVLLATSSLKFGRASIAEPADVKLPTLDHGVDLPTTLPVIIAHRGASGVFPAHTVPAYTEAVKQGADVIECDVQITRDLQLICDHDPWLNLTTDISEKTEFLSRISTYNVTDPIEGTTARRDYFAIDFDLQELQESVRVVQSYDFRNQQYNGMYKIPTLQELIDIVKSADRTIGLHIETKVPDFYNQHPVLKANNVTFEKLVVDVLQKNGYSSKRDPCFLQSFSLDSLKALQQLTQLPLVFLNDYYSVPSDGELEAWSEFLYGIGPWHPTITDTGATYYKGAITKPNDLISRAHRYGLKVHPYTFRNEDKYLSWSYQQDPLQEYALFIELGADGFFTDFPGTLRGFYDLKTGSDTGTNAANSVTAKVHVIALFGIVLIGML